MLKPLLVLTVLKVLKVPELVVLTPTSPPMPLHKSSPPNFPSIRLNEVKNRWGGEVHLVHLLVQIVIIQPAIQQTPIQLLVQPASTILLPVTASISISISIRRL